jgi:starch synthase (maltosyl-transferring)
MHRLAKLGFNQSYTYFAWKNTRHELVEYFTELTQTKAIEYFRANVWPNTPDILNAYLVEGGRPAFMARLVLAGTISANYGIYGPAFELGERVPREPGSEEYLNSEKYELRHWDIDRPDSLRPLIARVNQIRRDNPALQDDRSLQFHNSDNEMLLCYSKTSLDEANVIVTVINLDPNHLQSGWVELPLEQFDLTEHEPFHVHDLLTDHRYTWRGRWNYIELNPHVLPAHVFSLQITPDATTATP